MPFSALLAYDAARTKTTASTYSIGQRPDVVPGAGNNPVTGDPNRWFDISAFQRPQPGFLGNLGRNTLQGPGLANVDITLAKEFPLRGPGERGGLQFQFSCFNLLNHSNLDIPEQRRATVFTATGITEDAGRITSAQPSRQIQIGMRLSF